jgi:hypothetical protein
LSLSGIYLLAAFAIINIFHEWSMLPLNFITLPASLLLAPLDDKCASAIL